jgi:hypothetical protein
MAIMVFVSQHEEKSTRAPRFCVAYQATHAVAAEGTHAVTAEGTHVVAADGTHAVAGDGSNAVTAEGTHVVAADGTHAVAGDGSNAVTADRHTRGPWPGLPRTAPRVPHAGGGKNYKVSTRPPPTIPLSPRVSNCPFSLPALNAQLTSSGVLVTVFRVCGNGDYGVC